MKSFFYGVAMTLAAIPACFGQSGTDINTAIPIYFNQMINNTLDSSTLPNQVYSIALAKGQQLSATATSPSGKTMQVLLYNSATASILTTAGSNSYQTYAQGNGGASITYQVATAGVYYLRVWTNSTSVPYTFEATAIGTPIGTPNPTQSGCVTGQVQNITYSLDLIAAGLPDSVTIGTTQLCATCTLKPPAYPQLVEKMEKAMGLGVGVMACYDSTGSIFQLQLNHP
jgi:hypothetical protein